MHCVFCGAEGRLQYQVDGDQRTDTPIFKGYTPRMGDDFYELYECRQCLETSLQLDENLNVQLPLSTYSMLLDRLFALHEKVAILENRFIE